METESGNVQENRYDVENLRFELLENGRKTSFVYHNGELLHEEGREEQKTSYHLGAGIDAFQRGQKFYYYQQDEQLSTALVIDGQGGIQNCYLYDALGVETEIYEQLPNRIRYTGHHKNQKIHGCWINLIKPNKFYAGMNIIFIHRKKFSI